MKLEETFDDQFDVSQAFVSPMRDPQGDRLTNEDDLDTARGLAIDGAYGGGGRGELFVSYTEGKRMLKFPIGVDSRTSTEVDISLVLDECEYAPQAIDIMRPDPLLPAYLSMICDKRTRRRGSIYPAFAYAGDVPIRFEVESDDGFFPVDMAGLSDGSLMILFRGPNRRSGRRTMRIGLASSRDLSLAMRRRGGTVAPQIILEVAESDGFNIGLTSGLATREHDDRIFVYIVNDGTPITYLTTFEWLYLQSVDDRAIPTKLRDAPTIVLVSVLVDLICDFEPAFDKLFVLPPPHCLGFILNPANMIITLSDDKISTFRSDLASVFVQGRTVKTKARERLLGRVSWVAMPFIRLRPFLKPFHFSLAVGKSRNLPSVRVGKEWADAARFLYRFFGSGASVPMHSLLPDMGGMNRTVVITDASVGSIGGAIQPTIQPTRHGAENVSAQGRDDRYRSIRVPG
ncbi:hypothetical protein FOZ61_010418 [Perkinsus olseni]|uniref:Uncharacterized protein n=1 Tax=Perkinsus olseni TaxID=32597 RepID=A0A7J6KW78_PEROL|nr:hypothetical protein FOZ61_010418 [Perkinsus olseni]KAF4660931.1 hypothetical protein FOL46_005937 [Perkinsus olseni]